MVGIGGAPVHPEPHLLWIGLPEPREVGIRQLLVLSTLRYFVLLGNTIHTYHMVHVGHVHTRAANNTLCDMNARSCNKGDGVRAKIIHHVRLDGTIITSGKQWTGSYTSSTYEVWTNPLALIISYRYGVLNMIPT